MLIDPGFALLNERVAEAADAWLTDPQDAGVYQRLLAAVAERRALSRGVAQDGVVPVRSAVDRGAANTDSDAGTFSDTGAAVSSDADASVPSDADASVLGADADVDGGALDSTVRAVGDLLDPTDVRAALARLRGVR